MARFGYTTGTNVVLVILWFYVIATGIQEGNPRDSHLMIIIPTQILAYALLAIAHKDDPTPEPKDDEPKGPPIHML